ncbi:folate receptor gamma-like isoform X2 [Physella acuta]|nr:folate receptor gamma-like isoform X2 [Physella acuta]XP_059151116.1 folate receptor gamma-like isoform X2 [Physella acuta]XP_059151124.1 folate receptor gamma-like isoform X2 [Physella acuta]XP_059151132.1 folate receptor gamma-like isoform X2 [Physella acuta]XP_059151140.1 folate receptor gamma-like isoform X2 [Physella acuta]XP_059151146.1 folate receptor gamma-like isoform X2 [Physella acuta]
MLELMIALVTLLPLTSARLDSLKTVDDYLNICLDGRNHKSAPGPENELLTQYCKPWAKRSCCSSKVVKDIDTSSSWLNFNWDHCQQLSPQCREQFLMDLCFYECSPNVGPWLQQDTRKIRKERFRDVPLCQPVCDRWWDACNNDFTCTDNWAAGFNWSTGINTCPEGNKCRPFHQVYSGANNFCETVMGNSFKVVPETEDCFYTWFSPNEPNPNEPVARKKAAQLLGIGYSENSSEVNAVSWQSFVFLILGAVIFC